MFLERLERYRRTRQLVGFCKWTDGRGLLWGRVGAVDAGTVRFELVAPSGQPDGPMTVRLDQLTRLLDSPDYARRLELFARLDPPVGTRKPQVSRSRTVIRARLVEAVATGECVSIRLKDDPARDCRVLRVDDDAVQFEEYGDDPLKVDCIRIVCLTQIKELAWRSTTELAVTRVWHEARSRKRRARR